MLYAKCTETWPIEIFNSLKMTQLSHTHSRKPTNTELNNFDFEEYQLISTTIVLSVLTEASIWEVCLN